MFKMCFLYVKRWYKTSKLQGIESTFQLQTIAFNYLFIGRHITPWCPRTFLCKGGWKSSGHYNKQLPSTQQAENKQLQSCFDVAQNSTYFYKRMRVRPFFLERSHRGYGWGTVSVLSIVIIADVLLSKRKDGKIGLYSEKRSFLRYLKHCWREGRSKRMWDKLEPLQERPLRK